MPTSSTILADSGRLKLVENYYASNIGEDAHYKYDIRQKYYFDGQDYGTNITVGLVSKAAIKTIFKSEFYDGGITGGEFTAIRDRVNETLTHD